MRIPTALFAAATIFLSGCATVAPAPGYGSSAGTVSVAAKAPHGPYLVGPNGMSLYLLQGTRGTTGASRCSGECLRVWPPLLGGAPIVGPGINPAMLTVIQEPVGLSWRTWWPLYYYTRSCPG